MLTPSAREAAATATAITKIGLATGYPGVDGDDNEEAGGSYATQATTPTYTDGVISCADGPFNFTVDGSISWVLFKNASDDVRSFHPLEGSIKPYAVDPVTNVFRSPSHGLVDDDRVVFWTSVPTPLVAGTQYWVVSADTDTWQISATQGGAAIDITAAAPLPRKAVCSKISTDSGSAGRTVSLGTQTITLC